MNIWNTDLKPGVTVVVPCYNEEGAVTETVEAIAAVLDLGATDKNKPFNSEMIFVNDGSKDNTLKILRNSKPSIQGCESSTTVPTAAMVLL